MPKRRQDKIAGLAEKALDTWATQAGITINPSMEDRKGWDYILEFQLRHQEAEVPQNTPLDKDLREVKAFVQVKGSDDHHRFVDISLTNWQSLIGTPHPAHILRVEFDGEDKSQRAYLRHVDQEITREVLKRLRKVSAEEEDANELYKKTKRVRFRESDRLPSLDGSGLRSKMIEPLMGKPRSYEAQKRKWIDEIGYGESNVRIKTMINIPEEYRDTPSDLLVDFAAGIIPELDITKGQIYDTRFGIPIPQQPIGKGRLRPEKKFSHGVLTFETLGKQFDRIRLPVRVQQSNLPPDEIPSDRLRIQMHGPGVTIITTYEQNQVVEFSLSIDSYRKESLTNLDRAAQLIDYLLEKAKRKEQTRISFTHNDEKGRLGILRAQELEENSNNLLTRLQQARDWVRHAITVAKKADIPLDAEVQCSQIERQKAGLVALSNLINGNEINKFKFVIANEQPHKEENRIGVPLPLVVSFGEWLVLAVVVLVGPLESSSEGSEGDLREASLITNEAYLPLTASIHTDENVPDSVEVVEIAIQRLEKHFEKMPEVRLIPEGQWMIMDPLQAKQMRNN